MLQGRISLELPVVLIQPKLFDDAIHSLLQRSIVKTAALHEGLAVVDGGRKKRGHPANVPSVDLWAKDLRRNHVVLLDSILGSHAKPKEHDTDDATCASSGCKLKVVGRTAGLSQALLSPHPVHYFGEDLQGHDASDTTSIEGEKAGAVGMLGSRSVDMVYRSLGNKDWERKGEIAERKFDNAE